MVIEKKLLEMGIELPETPKPVAAYIPAIRSGDLVFTSGQIPVVRGEVKYAGKVGTDISIEDAYQAAKICALNALSAAKSVVGDLDKIDQVVKVVGFVNSIPGFTQQPAVINGASEFFKELFGERGIHARSAVGVAELPLNVAVELEVIFRVKK
ncbi:RidA family protein [candidate division KSB1 bacterium]|nr:RidA family protein [candidate division KSB1 bacterium]